MKAIKDFCLLFCLGLVALACIAWYTGAHDVKASTTSSGRSTSTSTGPGAPLANVDQAGSIVGKPTVSAQFIDQILCRYGSPACGHGRALYVLGAQYGVDPVYALAFFWHESTLGTRGMARITHSIGNLRCIDGAACVNTRGDQCQAGQSCYASWPSYEDGARAWYVLITGPLYIAGGLDTVAEIIPRYAPSADNNNEAAYIASVNAAVSLWRSGTVALP